MDFPRYRGHARASRCGLLEGLGADTTQVAVPAGTIVEDLDVIEEVSAGELAGFVDALTHPLLLQGAEERFGYCVIPAIGAPTHAGIKVVGGAESRPVLAAVLRALIRMDDHALLRFAPPQRHQQGIKDKLAGEY